MSDSTFIILQLLIFYFPLLVNPLPIESNYEVTTEDFILRRISRSSLTVIEGDNFTISVFVSRNDLVIEEKWIKKTVFVPRITNTSQVIQEDSRHFLHSHKAGNDSAIKTLQITQATSRDIGVYVYSVTLKDHVKLIEFEVMVENVNAVPQLKIMSSTNYVLFNQAVYPRNMEVTVICLIDAHSVSSGTPVVLQHRNDRLSFSYLDPPPGSLTKVSGTFEKGLKWTLQLTEQYNEFKCSNKANPKSFVTQVLATDYVGVPEVSVFWDKPQPANEIEELKEIYEGDNVQFVWKSTENDKNWISSNVTWSYNGREMKSFVNTMENRTNSIGYTIKNISSNQSGDYVCTSLFYGVEAEFKRTIDVLAVQKPYRMSPSPENTIEFIYDSEVTFACEMNGSPKPKFIWTKDGNVFREGKGLSSNNYTLTITRLTAEDNGKFACTAVNRAGSEQYKFSIKVNDAPERISGAYLGLFGIGMMIVLICFAIALVKYWKQKKQTELHNIALSVLFQQLNGSCEKESLLKFDPSIPINQMKQRLQYNKQYEIERENLQIGSTLGTGEFGEVWRGWLRRPRNTNSPIDADDSRLAVSVKGARSVLNPIHCQMLVDELRAFCAIGKHPNVLALVGAVTKTMQNGELLIAMELCEKSNLKDYLIRFQDRFVNELRTGVVNSDDYINGNTSQLIYADEENPNHSNELKQKRLLSEEPTFLATSDLISFALQVASGMEYIASVPCIHRDLAARNVLVTSRGICKIADFGMARNDDYYKFQNKKDIPAPYRWMAIEAIELGSYTEKTDIWSFGVLLYEIFTLGALPYASIPSGLLMDKLKDGYRNRKPQYSHAGIFGLMEQCWDAHPHLRPNFNQCVSVLKQHLTLASPQLFERLMQETEHEKERQNLLPEWLIPEDYKRSITRIDSALLPSENKSS